MDNLGSSIKRIIEIDYEQAFSNAKRFLSLLDDLAPSELEGKKVFRRVITNELLLRFRVLNDVSECDTDLELLKIKKYLSDDMGLSEYWIETVISSFADAFDIIYLPSISSEEQQPFSKGDANKRILFDDKKDNDIESVDCLFSKSLNTILFCQQNRVSNDIFIKQAVEICQNCDYQTAFKLFYSEAKKDNIFAMTLLGLFYEFGYGVKADIEKTMFWFQKAVDNGEPNAMEQFGEIYRFGRNNATVNYKEALKWFTKAADLGQAEAMYYLGVMYSLGEGVEENGEKAFQWFKKASEENNVDALECLGDYYLNGSIVQQDYAEAFNCFMIAAENNSSYASFKIATMFDNGTGMPKSHNDAIKWYLRAAELGNPEAQLKIGFAYLKGDCVEQNYFKSVEFFEKSNVQGLLSAKLALGMMYECGYGIQKNPFKAFECYKSAAEQGEENSQYSLGLCYANGIGVEKNYIEAVKCMQKASSVNDHNAINWLKNENIEIVDKRLSCYYGSNTDGDYMITGTWSDGKIIGQGNFYYIAGKLKSQRYQGCFLDGCFNGEGIYFYADNDKVYGTFQNGFNGNLTHEKNKRIVYKGSYLRGKPNGSGISYNEDGTGFQGEFRNGRAWNGQGAVEFTTKSGKKMKAIGKFSEGELNGVGRLINLNRGEWFEGYFVNSQYHGDGVLHFKDGTKVMGYFEDGLNGVVKIIDSNNKITYEGGYKDGSYHGQGTLYNSDGSILQGNWSDGLIVQGQGTRIHKLRSGVTVRDTGFFENGNLSGKGKRYIVSGKEAGGYWEGNFNNGALDGLCIFHNKEGGRQESQCVKGVFHGLTRSYSAFGVFCWETVYDNGTEIGPRKESYLYSISKDRQ